MKFRIVSVPTVNAVALQGPAGPAGPAGPSGSSDFGSGVAAALAIAVGAKGGLWPNGSESLLLTDSIDASDIGTLRLNNSRLQFNVVYDNGASESGYRNLLFEDGLKTINGQSIPGSGNISIAGYSLPSMTGQSGKFLSNNGSIEFWGTPSIGSLLGFGSGVAAALAIAVGSAGAFQRNNDGFNGTLGAVTPASAAVTTLNTNGQAIFRLSGGVAGTDEIQITPMATTYIAGSRISSPNGALEIRQASGCYLQLGSVAGNATVSVSDTFYTPKHIWVGAFQVPLKGATNATISIESGAVAMGFEVYGTYTNSTNYRRLRFGSTTAGAFSITAEGLGTGLTGNTLALVGVNAISSQSDLITNIASGADAVFQSNGSETFRVKSGTQGVSFPNSASAINWFGTASLSRNASGILQIGTTANNALGSLLLTNLTASGAVVGGGGLVVTDNAAASAGFGAASELRFFSSSGTVWYARWNGSTIDVGSGTRFQWHSTSALGTADLSLSRLNSTTLQVGTAGSNANGNIACGGLVASVAGVTAPVLIRDTSYNYFYIDSSSVRFQSGMPIAWYSGISILGTRDLSISRNVAGVLQIGGASNDASGSLLLTNLTASGTLGFSQSRFQQFAAQTLQTQCFDTTLAAWQETTRSQASSTGAKWSVLGATPIVQQTLPAAATDAATTQTLCNAIRSLLINFGFSN